MRIICNECNGTGIVKVPNYDGNGTAVIYYEYTCNECDGEGWIEIENISPASTTNIIIEY